MSEGKKLKKLDENGASLTWMESTIRLSIILSTSRCKFYRVDDFQRNKKIFCLDVTDWNKTCKKYEMEFQHQANNILQLRNMVDLEQQNKYELCIWNCSKADNTLKNCIELRHMLNESGATITFGKFLIPLQLSDIRISPRSI